MKSEINLKLGMLLLMGIFLVSFVSAEFISSNPQLALPFSSENTGFDSSLCSEDKDFILQINPLKCSPAVVRSDLLEEQDVQVYCEILATLLNPLIELNSIENLKFSKDLPPEVSNVVFYPARAALSTEQNYNSPLFNRVGYVVINIKQQPNESSMPDLISGNLTVEVEYDIENAFGIGDARFYLPELSSENWNENYKLYSFWNGKGYLRADEVKNDGATISVYDKKLNRVSSLSLSEGETSSDIFIPGFDYCQGSLNIKLEGLENPDIRAQIKINSEIIEVAKGEKFLDNRCTVVEIKKGGLNQKVVVKCREDSGTNQFSLTISPKVNLSINGAERSYVVGERLPIDYEDKSVYLGYVGSDKTGSSENLFVYLVAMPDEGEMLSDQIIDEIDSNAESINSEVETTKVGIIDESIEAIKKSGSWLKLKFIRWVSSGQNFAKLKSKTEAINVFGASIQIVDFAGSADLEINEEISNHYYSALNDFDRISDSYSEEEYQTFVLEEEALYNKIILSHYLNQFTITVEFCEEFRERYPVSNKDLDNFCDSKYKLSNSKFSSKYVTINGEQKQLSLEKIEKPTFEEFGVVVQVKRPDGSIIPLELRSNDVMPINEETDESMLLVSLKDNSAEVKISLDQSKGKLNKVLSSPIRTLEKDIPLVLGEYSFTLKEVKLERVAKVSVISNINNKEGSAEFGFSIGIEKRNFPLSPEKIQSQLEFLNKSISTFETISDVLDTTVEYGNKACLATSSVLTIVNLIENAQGKGIARKYVMQGVGGWYEKCKQSNPNDIDKCLLDNNDKIEAQVDAYYGIIQEQNTDIKSIQSQFSTKHFAETIVSTEEFLNAYSEDVSGERLDVLGNSFVNPNNEKESINIAEMKQIIKEGANKGFFTTEELRDIDFNLRVLAENSNDENAKIKLYKLLSDVKENSGTFSSRINDANTLKIDPDKIGFFDLTGKVKKIPYGGLTNTDIGISNIDSRAPAQVVQSSGSSGGTYIVILDDSSGTDLLPIAKNNEGNFLIYDMNKNLIEVPDDYVSTLQNLYFQKYDASSYENEFKNPEVRYYETPPYKGFPAIVPFDLKNGWYAATRQTLPVGNNIRSVDDSGRVSSFYLCNVGQNHLAEFFNGINDDECVGINIPTGQPQDQFPYLDEISAANLGKRAVKALEQASSQHRTGSKSIVIEGQTIKVGNPAVNLPEITCQDFMSPKECAIIFNVCDPFVCPSSRCDFGGKYPVQDVVQTGIVGSILMCMPNFIGFGGDVAVPICITGVKAGVDNWLSIQNAYKDCLEESLETGKNIGICDEMNSIYMCELFWRQVAPLASISVQSAGNWMTGQGTHGGGEYLAFQDAFQGAQDSVNYFTQEYGESAFSIFKARSTQEIGAVVCQNFISAVVPSSVDVIDSLTKADSPAQFTGRFDEIPYSTATTPAISHYKVFYHIYAGENEGAYYSVYLKSGTESSFYQDTANTRLVDSGYISVGEYVSNTEDFTAPSGYKKLCINVNGQEFCDFKEVSTSFAVNYVQDKYASWLANDTTINSEEECVSGDFFGIDSTFVSPRIYERGITRICATSNPGLGSDPYAETEDSRWMQVGNCGNPNLKCWLDMYSVKDVIDFKNFEEETLESISDYYLNVLISERDYLTDKEFENNISDAKDKEAKERIKIFTELFKKLFYNHQKAYVHLLRGDAFSELARKAFDKIKDEVTKGEGITTATDEKPEDVLDKTQESESDEICQQYLDIKETHGDLFNKYAMKNPNGWEVNDFKALLVAIAHRQSQLGLANLSEGTDWIMEYGWVDGERLPRYEGIETQISAASEDLRDALNKDFGNINSDYKKCKNKILQGPLTKCTVGVYLMGNKPTTGIEKILGITNEANEPVDEVLELWEMWKKYFNGKGDGICINVADEVEPVQTKTGEKSTDEEKIEELELQAVYIPNVQFQLKTFELMGIDFIDEVRDYLVGTPSEPPTEEEIIAVTAAALYVTEEKEIVPEVTEVVKMQGNDGLVNDLVVEPIQKSQTKQEVKKIVEEATTQYTLTKGTTYVPETSTQIPVDEETDPIAKACYWETESRSDDNGNQYYHYYVFNSQDSKWHVYRDTASFIGECPSADKYFLTSNFNAAANKVWNRGYYRGDDGVQYPVLAYGPGKDQSCSCSETVPVVEISVGDTAEEITFEEKQIETENQIQAAKDEAEALYNVKDIVSISLEELRENAEAVKQYRESKRIENYETSNYKKLLEEASKNYPSDPIFAWEWKPYEFKALLVAVAEEMGNLGYPDGRYNQDWLMGWKVGNNLAKGAEEQISLSGITLRQALEGEIFSQCFKSSYQLAAGTASGREEHLVCILEAYAENEEYPGVVAESIVKKWNFWKDYFKDEKLLTISEREYVVPLNVIKAVHYALETQITDLKKSEKWESFYSSYRGFYTGSFDISEIGSGGFSALKNKGVYFELLLREYAGMTQNEAKEIYDLFVNSGNIILIDSYTEQVLFHERMHKAINEGLSSNEINTLRTIGNNFVIALDNGEFGNVGDLFSYREGLDGHWEEIYTYMAENEWLLSNKRSKYVNLEESNSKYRFVAKSVYEPSGEFYNFNKEAYRIYKKAYEYASNLDENYVSLDLCNYNVYKSVDVCMNEVNLEIQPNAESEEETGQTSEVNIINRPSGAILSGLTSISPNTGACYWETKLREENTDNKYYFYYLNEGNSEDWRFYAFDSAPTNTKLNCPVSISIISKTNYGAQSTANWQKGYQGSPNYGNTLIRYEFCPCEF